MPKRSCMMLGDGVVAMMLGDDVVVMMLGDTVVGALLEMVLVGGQGSKIKTQNYANAYQTLYSRNII